MFLFCLVFAMFCARLFICALWSPAGKGLTSWLSFVVSSLSLSLSHWYPGSGVVLDCIDSWSLQPYYLVSGAKFKKNNVALRGVLSTRVYVNFKTYRNWRFCIFHVSFKRARDNWIILYMKIVCNMCKQYLSCSVKWRHSFWCYWRC